MNDKERADYYEYHESKAELMSTDRDPIEFCCDRCAQWFSVKELVEDGDMHYCKECEAILTASEDI